MLIDVLYEDENFIAVNKPTDISVHKSAGNMEDYTVADWILENKPEIKNVGEDMEVEYKGGQIKIARPGIVHRLDRDTSGVLLIAKNEATYNFLKDNLKNVRSQKLIKLLFMVM